MNDKTLVLVPKGTSTIKKDYWPLPHIRYSVAKRIAEAIERHLEPVTKEWRLRV